MDVKSQLNIRMIYANLCHFYTQFTSDVNALLLNQMSIFVELRLVREGF